MSEFMNGRKLIRVWLAICFGVLAAGGALWALTGDLTLVATLHEPQAEHADQFELLALVKAGEPGEAFEMAFEDGDELFETVFNALDGVGANVGDGERFTRVPRADLPGPASGRTTCRRARPARTPLSCNACHNLPFDDGAGGASANVHRDPQHSGDLARFIQRNTPHLFAPGAVQRLAEEMTTALQGIARRRDSDRVPATAGASARALSAKGVSFGSITANPRTGTAPCTWRSTRRASSACRRDLVVRPFQWKGAVASLRDFNRDASHNELGMQPVELVGDGVDGDGDDVADELSIGDETALAVYLASQPRPTTRVELARLGLIPALTPEESAAIRNGASTFAAVGCADCHTPRMRLEDPIFREPSRHPAYRDARFPSGRIRSRSRSIPRSPCAST